MTITFDTQRRRRGHNFLPPAAVRRRVPALYATEGVHLPDKVLHVKWFCGSWTWYAAEIDWDTGTAFGWVDGPSPEWGNFDLTELEAATPSWLVVERDCHWQPTIYRNLKGTS